MKYSRWILLVLAGIAVLYLSIYGAGSTVKKEYSITERSDGGYSVSIVLHKRYWKLITAEGIFPSVRYGVTIDLQGEGKDWGYRNQKGYYYGLDEIQSIQGQWDFGYAWLTDDRKYLYLNLFWVRAPDGMMPADVNGRYSLQAAVKE